MFIVDLEGLTLPEMRAKLKAARLEVRRHKALIDRMDKLPSDFLCTNGRQLVRDWLYTAQIAVRNLETAILERAKANGTPGRRQL